MRCSAGRAISEGIGMTSDTGNFGVQTEDLGLEVLDRSPDQPGQRRDGAVLMEVTHGWRSGDRETLTPFDMAVDPTVANLAHAAHTVGD